MRYLLILMLSASSWGQMMQAIMGASASATPTVVQGCSNAHSGGNTALNCVFGSPITATHSLYVCATHNTGSAPTWSGDSGTFVTDPGSTTAVAEIQWN